MDSKKWTAVLKQAKKLQKQDQKVVERLQAFLEVISPESTYYSNEVSALGGFLSAIESLHGYEAVEHIEYYLYEVPSLVEKNGKCFCRTKDGVEYDASKLSEYVKWLMAI